MRRLGPGLLAAAVLASGIARAQPPAPPTAIYTPDLASDPEEDASYPRILRRAHAGADNGELLATFFHKGARTRGEFPIYSSRDGGRTWSTRPIGVVRDALHGWDLDAPTLFELPSPMGDLPSGALLSAGTAWVHGDFTQQDVQVYSSTNGGRSWRYRSSCAREAGMPNREGLGIWEPTFAVAADGSLACFFSDERPSVQGFNQVLAHVRSTDGGRTWGPETWDVAVHDGKQRPGMATVTRVSGGRYAMAFEDCRKDLDPDTACSVHVKTSPDGLDWSPVASVGVRADDAGGRHLLHTPWLAWSAWGGPEGTLILSGQRFVSGPEGALKVLSQSGRVLLSNAHSGEGPWSVIAAPVIVDPTGGYDPGETGCAGYSSPVLPDTSGPSFLLAAGLHEPNGKCRVMVGRGSLQAAPAIHEPPRSDNSRVKSGLDPDLSSDARVISGRRGHRTGFSSVEETDQKAED